jgi:hypothetical protein
MRTYASRALEHPGRYIFLVSDPALRTVAGSYCAVLCHLLWMNKPLFDLLKLPHIIGGPMDRERYDRRYANTTCGTCIRDLVPPPPRHASWHLLCTYRLRV